MVRKKAESSQSSPTAGRDTNGRFAKGNAGGPGNPHARRCAHLLVLFREAITAEDMHALFRKLFEMARDGNTGAIKIILAYLIGKPHSAPDPDMLDLDEWHKRLKNGVAPDDVSHLFKQPTTETLNQVARAALPMMQARWAGQLAQGILDKCDKKDSDPEEIDELADDAPLPDWDMPLEKATRNGHRRNQSGSASDALQVDSTKGNAATGNGAAEQTSAPIQTGSNGKAKGSRRKKLAARILTAALR